MFKVIKSLTVLVLVVFWFFVFIVTLGPGYLAENNWKLILTGSLVSGLCLIALFAYGLFYHTVQGIQTYSNRKKGWMKETLGHFSVAVLFLGISLFFSGFSLIPALNDLQQGPISVSTQIYELQMQKGRRNTDSYFVLFCSKVDGRLNMSFSEYMTFWQKLYAKDFYPPCSQNVEVLYLPNRKDIINITLSQ